MRHISSVDQNTLRVDFSFPAVPFKVYHLCAPLCTTNGQSVGPKMFHARADAQLPLPSLQYGRVSRSLSVLPQIDAASFVHRPSFRPHRTSAPHYHYLPGPHGTSVTSNRAHVPPHLNRGSDHRSPLAHGSTCSLYIHRASNTTESAPRGSPAVRRQSVVRVVSGLSMSLAGARVRARGSCWLCLCSGITVPPYTEEAGGNSGRGRGFQPRPWRPLYCNEEDGRLLSTIIGRPLYSQAVKTITVENGLAITIFLL